MTKASLQAFVTSYVDAAKQAGTWTASTNNIYGLLDKIGKQITLEGYVEDKLPEFELTNKYIDKLDGYLVDQFPLRDEYRSIKALYNYNVLNMLVNNDIYFKDNYIFKSMYPTNKNSINNFVNHVNKTTEFMNEDNNIYFVLVPDKNYYLESDDFLNIEYDYIYNEISNIDNINFIDIRNVLSLDDYYETDTHWRQENISKVVNVIVDEMGYEYKDIEYKVNEYDKFYGVYYGESAINRKLETLRYLSNDTLDNVRVEYLEDKEFIKVYNVDKLNGMDAYDVYLNGATPYIEIYNDNSTSNKELIIFRDSFGSSISPLLVEYYSKDFYLNKSLLFRLMFIPINPIKCKKINNKILNIICFLLFFSNSNIFPKEEYEKRFSYLKSLGRIYNLQVICDEYNHESWLEAVKGFENEPEKGKRCEICFRYNLTRAADKADELGIKEFTTTLSVSPHKISEMLFSVGQDFESFVPYNFKKKDGFRRSLELSEKYKLYRQDYCGCEFSKAEAAKKN